MPIYNSRQAGMLFFEQHIFSFYHQTIPSDNDTYTFYTYLSMQQPAYKLGVSELKGKYRCLQYKQFNTYQYQDIICPLVLCVDASGGCNVLFETNFPFIKQEDGNIVCTFWSTLQNGQTCMKSSTGNSQSSFFEYGKAVNKNSTISYYKYDPSLIYKLNVQNLSQIDLENTQYKNILCAVKISLQPLYVSVDDGVNKFLQQVAIVRNLPIVLDQYQSSSPTFDFSVQGGSGGGIKQHNHIPHIDGTSFAFAVFHPGTTMPQLPWK